MRETSRLLVLPLTEQVDAVPNSEQDDCIDAAGSDIHGLVWAGQHIPHTVPKVKNMAKRLTEVLPGGDSTKRLAQNYAMWLVFTELVCIDFQCSSVIITDFLLI